MSLENVEIVRALQPPPDWNLVTQFGDDAAFAVVAKGIAPHLDDDFEALGSAGVEKCAAPRARGLASGVARMARTLGELSGRDRGADRRGHRCDRAHARLRSS